MSSDFKALEQLESEAGRLLGALDDAGRRDILRKIARELKAGQAARIAKQQSPNGAAFAPRKKRGEPRGGNGARRFLYPSGGNGPARIVFMKSWSYDGPLMTGFDVEAGGIRSFETKKIIKFLGVSPAEDNKASGGNIRNRLTIKQKAMFRKLRTGRYLKSGVDDYGLWVGFLGKVAGIARIHQEGGRDRTSRRGPTVQYAQRELLGFTNQDREDILDLVLRHMDV
ncbi:phage virion morphogenesis protein [Asticcacaulis solisilvae]|uniref:phage virion morphogenesis protein n=1 Tax=Asticcacaulis solisilvae TaxID=1217274 RepID=UPI003FD8A79E